MRAVDILRKKRAGSELSREEIAFLVRGYCGERIPDYQISAFLMAVTFNGMSDRETGALAEEMMNSGAVVDLSGLKGPKVDKHSTGGVGDKTSLVLAPAMAAAGLIVPMISGRGLAHTGGTLDKLESIPGFNAGLTRAQFLEILSVAGAAVTGQTEDLVPADRKLYALRDVTATVDCHPLIATSIMSKKLAEGIDALVLDVKTGSGAFMKTMEDAEALARAMVGIGKASGKRVVALITDMNQPLGECVGNSLEVEESLELLKGRGPADLYELCRELAAHALLLGDREDTLEEARSLFDEVVRSGRALAKLREIVRLQGGDAAVVDDYSRLPRAGASREFPAAREGYIQSMETEKIGYAMCLLGAGRERIDDTIDHSVGMRLHKKIGDRVQAGTALCTVFYNDERRLELARPLLEQAFGYSDTRPHQPDLIRKVID